MKSMRALIIFALGAMVGFGVAVVGYSLHSHLDLAKKAQHLERHTVTVLDRAFGAKVSAAKLADIAPPAPYFPPGSIWTKDISHAPLDPNSSTMISWLADAGGWGHGKMQVDFSIRVLQANATTPQVPFKKGDIYYSPDSDMVSTFPLPVGGGIEG